MGFWGFGVERMWKVQCGRDGNKGKDGKGQKGRK